VIISRVHDLDVIIVHAVVLGCLDADDGSNAVTDQHNIIAKCQHDIFILEFTYFYLRYFENGN